MTTVLVVYHSDTGNTKRLAELIADGARGVAGAVVELVPAAEVDVAVAAVANGLALGSPDYFSYMAGQLKTFFDRALADKRFKGKPCVCFGTHGGGGGVLATVENLAKAIGLKAVSPGIQTKGAPASVDEPKARELGRRLAQAAGA